MSLMERVVSCGNSVPDYGDIVLEVSVDELKNALYRHISSDEIALLAADNPMKAQNEIRSICRHIFEEPHYLSLDSQTKDSLVSGLIDSVFGLGPLESLLNDESITEIMVNGCTSLFYERGGKLYSNESIFSDNEQVRTLIDRIIGPLGRRIDESSPMVNARLPKGHRVNAVIPPLSLDGPILTIRKFREHIFSLDEMLEGNSMDALVRQFMEWAVLARCNIAVSGGTGSGKTTLLNALSSVIPHNERIITIEDSAELRFLEHPHVIRLEARPQNAEGIGEVSIRDLVVNSLRMRPDRIIVGECRAGEALDMLQAMNTGHDGSLTTLHANSTNDAIKRLSTMVRYAADLPIGVIESQIASALDLIIHIARGVDGHRYIHEIAGYKQSEEGLTELRVFYRWDLISRQGRWYEAPDWLDRLAPLSIVDEKEVQIWLASLSL